MQSNPAVSFFCVSGAQDDTGKFSFRNTKRTFVAKAEGTKAERLNGTAELHELQATDTVAFELQTAQATRDWSKEPGREATNNKDNTDKQTNTHTDTQTRENTDVREISNLSNEQEEEYPMQISVTFSS